MSNSDFALNINAWITKVKVDINQKVINVASELLKEVYKRTPQTTGHLAYNWIVSLDAPKSGTRGKKPPKGLDPDTRAQLIAANPSQNTVPDGLAVIKTFDIKKNKSIWISNNVDYAYEVEYIGAFGGELGAPASMARTSVDIVQHKLNTL